MESQDYIPALPPSSVDAERSVLGAVLQDSGAATLAFETLSPEDFYTAEHREIFSAMQTLHIAGIEVQGIDEVHQALSAMLVHTKTEKKPIHRPLPMTEKVAAAAAEPSA